MKTIEQVDDLLEQICEDERIEFVDRMRHVGVDFESIPKTGVTSSH